MTALTVTVTVTAPNTAKGHATRALIACAGPLCTFGVLVLMMPHGGTYALDAAGAFKGDAIEGIAKFVEKLQGNLVWLGGTAMGLVIAVVGIMFMAGHSRAHDLAVRTLVGLLILASVGGIVA